MPRDLIWPKGQGGSKLPDTDILSWKKLFLWTWAQIGAHFLFKCWMDWKLMENLHISSFVRKLFSFELDPTEEKQCLFFFLQQ